MTALTQRHPLPPAADVEQLLACLLDRDVSVSVATAPAPGEPVVSCVYRDDAGELAGMLLADAALTNAAGAALGFAPPEKVVEANARAVVDPVLLTNFGEVANVASRWFNGRPWPHVVLASLHGLGEPTPQGTMVFRFAPRGRCDYLVTVAGYGEGRLSVLAN